jgi:putative ABC transport system substrate-binding protein
VRRLLHLAPSLIAVALIGTSCASPVAPEAARIFRIGYLSGTGLTDTTASIEPLRQALRDLGYVEGKNLTIDIRAADGNVDQSPALAAELVARNPDLILVRGVPQATALKKATSSIPIVGVAIRNPVESGLAASLARPGGNLTGVASTGAETTQRRLQLLREVVPGAARIAFLYEPANPVGVQVFQEAQKVATTLGVELLPIAPRAPEDLTGLLAAARGTHPDAMFVMVSALTISQRSQILNFLAENRLASVTGTNRTFVDGGALIYYDADEAELMRKAAGYADKILKGANPSDLPIEGPSKFELIINMKTAKALGLTIPQAVLAQATELIQ